MKLIAIILFLLAVAALVIAQGPAVSTGLAAKLRALMEGGR